MAFADLLLLGAGAGLVYYLLKPQKQKETTQELLKFTDISDDGIIELPGFKFRACVEVVPVNMALRSFEEQAAIWAGFRNLLNSLTVACTFLIQTRYLNIRDYIENLKARSKDLPGSFLPYAEELASWLNAKVEGKSLRDRRYFVILKTDAGALEEEGIRVENELFDAALKSISKVGKAKLPPAEIRRQARDQLNEARNYVLSAFSGMDIAAFPLDRKGVLEMLYQTFNRDSASFFPQSFDEPPVLFPASRTPGDVLRRLEGEMDNA